MLPVNVLLYRYEFQLAIITKKTSKSGSFYRASSYYFCYCFSYMEICFSGVPSGHHDYPSFLHFAESTLGIYPTFPFDCLRSFRKAQGQYKTALRGNGKQGQILSTVNSR